MGYEWDPRKSEGNATKLGIPFADAVAVFDDERALTIEDPFEDERRFVTIGLDAFSRVLVEVYTWRGDTIRLISARKATRRERATYLKELP